MHPTVESFPSKVETLQAEVKRLKADLKAKEEIIQKLEAIIQNSNKDNLNLIDSHITEESKSTRKYADIEIDHSIQIQTIYAGEGDEFPLLGDVVKMHYKLSIVDSNGDCNGDEQVIEDSRVRYSDDPFSFILGKDQVIEGIELALMQMRRAEVAEFDLLSDLAYGEEGFGDVITAGDKLHCRLELIDFHTPTTRTSRDYQE